MVLYQPILLGQIADIRDYPEIVKFIAKIRKSKEQQKSRFVNSKIAY